MKIASRQHRFVSVVGSILLLALGAGSAEAAISATERATLLNLYTSTHGATWSVSTNWNGAAGSECSWYGVTCNGSGSSVTAINLPGNNLSGTLPADLANLTNLTYFFVNSNQLTGTLPSLAGLTSLSSFYANNNQLTGVHSRRWPALRASYHLLSQQQPADGPDPGAHRTHQARRAQPQQQQLTGSTPGLRRPSRR